MGFITGSQVKARLLTSKQDQAAKLCEEQRWEELGDGVGIYPFREEFLGAVTYDLTVGHQVYSLRRAEKQTVSNENPVRIEPG